MMIPEEVRLCSDPLIKIKRRDDDGFRVIIKDYYLNIGDRGKTRVFNNCTAVEKNYDNAYKFAAMFLEQRNFVKDYEYEKERRQVLQQELNEINQKESSHKQNMTQKLLELLEDVS